MHTTERERGRTDDLIETVEAAGGTGIAMAAGGAAIGALLGPEGAIAGAILGLIAGIALGRQQTPTR